MAPVSGSGGRPAPNPTSDEVALGVKDGNTATSDPVFGAAGGVTTEASGDGEESRADLNVFSPSNPLLVGSLALLAVGLLLFVLRFAGRRLR